MQLLPRIQWRRLEWTRDNDYQWGPFLYAKTSIDPKWAFLLDSGNGNEDKGCTLRIGLGRHTAIVGLPSIVKPYREIVKAHYWDQETISRLGRDWYPQYHSKRYGVSLSGNFFQCFYGAAGDFGLGSFKSRQWSCHLPWTRLRLIKHNLYDHRGHLHWCKFEGGVEKDFKQFYNAKESCPKVRFTFDDYDGQCITASTHIEEYAYRYGENWFKWVGYLRPIREDRILRLQFSSEIGSEKGSWKGGITGGSIEMLPEETHEQAFYRYCALHSLTFLEQVE